MNPKNSDYASYLITGGTGSLGTALTRYLLSIGTPPQNITLLARNETKLNLSRSNFPGVRCEAGDVRDFSWLTTLFPGHTCVIHAGALKVIPTAEVNVKETVTTNVIGSVNVAMAAVESGVKRVVGISTDKAAQPQTQYGASKFLMEGLFREANGWSPGVTSFNAVRYGNVLGSNASVLPLFRSLIKDNKPLTVTQFAMTRFWLSMRDAVYLVMEAVTLPQSGLVIVPEAKASDMYVFAKAVSPSDEYPLVETGARPGEKIHEKMIHAGEAHHTTRMGDRFYIHHPAEEVLDRLPEGFEYRSDTCDQFSIHALREKIAESE